MTGGTDIRAATVPLPAASQTAHLSATARASSVGMSKGGCGMQKCWETYLNLNLGASRRH
jgi:hypothetical protein